jgi:hypothetical protein
MGICGGYSVLDWIPVFGNQQVKSFIAAHEDYF